MFQNSVLDSQDVYTYMDIIQSGMPATNCNDLNRDGNLSVYDAALVNWCRRGNPSHPAGSAHNHCNFPRNIINPNDLVGVGIRAVDFTNNYVDVEIKSACTNQGLPVHYEWYQYQQCGNARRPFEIPC